MHVNIFAATKLNYNMCHNVKTVPAFIFCIDGPQILQIALTTLSRPNSTLGTRPIAHIRQDTSGIAPDDVSRVSKPLSDFVTEDT